MLDAHPTQDPLALLAEALERAKQDEPFDATAMSLATVDHRTRKPSVRVVLLKSVDPRGLTFFTNYESRKGLELDGHPHAAICLHWPKAEQQIRVEGSITHTTDEESDAYFATRPRGSQLGAWASTQSRPAKDREELEARVRDFEQRFEGKPVPRPPHWGGYLLTPMAVEFWYGRQSRLHDRFRYERSSVETQWSSARLFP